MSEEIEEIQRGARFSVNFTVECYPSSDRDQNETEEQAPGASFEGQVRNISSGGACLITAQPLKVNEILKVSFPIQSSISDFISTPRTLVEVRWTESADKARYLSGLRFLL
jgi:hypothetical protein